MDTCVSEEVTFPPTKTGALSRKSINVNAINFTVLGMYFVQVGMFFVFVFNLGAS